MDLVLRLDSVTVSSFILTDNTIFKTFGFNASLDVMTARATPLSRHSTYSGQPREPNLKGEPINYTEVFPSSAKLWHLL